jgi:hypothetical protein
MQAITGMTKPNRIIKFARRDCHKINDSTIREGGALGKDKKV